MTNKERMSKIGELQDEIIKLGFVHEIHDYPLEISGYIYIDVLVSINKHNYYDEKTGCNYISKIYIAFHADCCVVFLDSDAKSLEVDIFGFSNTAVIDKVKELINDK